eukprot:15468429-Alexandrium_andersonii.AAC.1
MISCFSVWEWANALATCFEGECILESLRHEFPSPEAAHTWRRFNLVLPERQNYATGLHLSTSSKAGWAPTTTRQQLPTWTPLTGKHSSGTV